MRYEDDIAFQRAILANPSDTTLKLVYADWLQDRSDPRAEFVRLQVQLNGMVGQESAAQAAEWLGKKGDNLDPKWIAFMTTLAQPFESITVLNEEFGLPLRRPRPYPFTEPIGRRGRVVTFESLYRAAVDWSDGLLADLVFLTSVEWGTCAAGCDNQPISGFLCEFRTEQDPPDKASIRKAFKTALREGGLGRISQGRADATLFGDGEGPATAKGPHGELKRYVTGGLLWYTDPAMYQPAEGPYSPSLSFAFGRSPNGNRLVGAVAIASR